MIEDVIWESIPDPRAVKQCIAVLAQSGVLQSQAHLELARLVEGDPIQDPVELAKEILRVRADTRGLLNLHEYGLQLTQELERDRNEES